MVRLNLKFLGKFEVILDGEAITRFKSKNVQALLLYLCLQPDKNHDRSKLSTLLWPTTSSIAKGKTNLRATLMHLRKVLRDTKEKELIQSTKSSISINESLIACDVLDLQNALKAKNFEIAAEIYRGELVPDFQIDSGLYYEWLVMTRQRLSADCLIALNELSNDYLVQGNFQQARTIALHQLRINQYNESGLRNLMIAAALDGSPIDALRFLHEFKQDIELEYGINLETKTIQLAKKIANGDMDVLPRKRDVLTTIAYKKAATRVEQAKQFDKDFLDLNELGLTDYDFTMLWPEISKINNLRFLDLKTNQLTELPQNIGQLAQLKGLELYDNYLVSLPDSIDQFTKLEVLNLENNKLETLPPSIQNIAGLRQLYLHNNPDLGIPPEILGATRRDYDHGNQPAYPQDILRYYFMQQTKIKRPINEAKLLLLGQGDVGKTSLVKRLVHGSFDPNERKTDGINIEQWHIANQFTPNQPIRVNVWDFGGQEIMHATHQFFLTERSLYLVILKSRIEADANRLDYWLQKVSNYGGNSPVIIVLNQIDQHTQKLDTRFYEEKYPDLIVGWHYTSCATGEGLDELKAKIEKEINTFDDVHAPFSLSWFKVKVALEQMAEHYIDRDRYAAICYEQGVTESQDQRLLLRLMHDLGIALNFDTIQLKETHILNPRWVTQGVYLILNDTKLALERGVLTQLHLNRILHQPQYRKMHKYIIHIMEQFELCFDVPHNKWLIPDLVSPVEPETGDWENVLRFRYFYPSVLEPSIMTRFITRMHEHIPNQTFWRSGAIIKHESNRAHIRADRDTKRIDIRIKGQQPTRRVLLALIREEFRKIHATIPHLPYEEHVPLPNDPEVFVSYNHLLKLEQVGQKTYFPDGADKPISVATLLNGVEDPKSRISNLEHELQALRSQTPTGSKETETFSQITKATTQTSAHVKIIKIFLASSAELREDRDAFDLYLRQQNDRLRQQGLYLEIIRWENFLDAMSKTRQQDEYNQAVRDCDIFVSLFKTKTGQYTEEEFDSAHQVFQETGSPLIYTYFKKAEVSTSPRHRKDLISLWDFQEKLDKLDHFYTDYESIADLQKQFRDQLDKLRDAGKI